MTMTDIPGHIRLFTTANHGETHNSLLIHVSRAGFLLEGIGMAPQGQIPNTIPIADAMNLVETFLANPEDTAHTALQPGSEEEVDFEDLLHLKVHAHAVHQLLLDGAGAGATHLKTQPHCDF